jgi:N-acetylmuramoyl-L-alanine amidase
MLRQVTSILTTFVLCLAVLSQGTASAQGNTRINDIQIGYDGRGLTRVVIFSSDKLDFTEHALIEGGLRYLLDFDRLEWNLPGKRESKGEGNGVGGIQRYRYAQYTDDISRLVFDLDQPVVVEGSFSVPPDARGEDWRIVIDFRTTDIETFRQMRPNAGQAAPPPPEQASGADDSLPQKSNFATQDVRRKPVIVIDAGHGGRDPGTIGFIKSTKEKDVNLKAAKKLRDILQASKAYKVILTRETDVLVDYEERIRIARDADADLFISIHADAAGNRTVQGASVYTLSEKGDKRLANKMDEGDWDMPLEVHAIYDDEAADGELEDILVSLMTRETQNHSAEFAEILIPELAKAGPVLRNTHRQANYYVLLSPNVPAVLLEIGFLSNSGDEARLSTDDGIAKSMKAVMRAIDLYFEEHDRRYSQYDDGGFFSRAG